MNASKRGAGETAPVLAYRVDYAKGEFQGFGFAGVHGKAANLRSLDPNDTSVAGVNPVSGDAYSTRDTTLNLFEFDAYFIRGDWTVQGQLSFGQQKNAAITADPVTGDLRDAQWYGLSTLVAYKFEPRLEGTARFDYLYNRKNGGGLLGYTALDDRNGIGYANGGDTERGVNRQALTLGLSYLFNLNTTFKVEYRHDRASGPVFLDVQSQEYRKSNNLLATSVLVQF